MAAPEVSVKVVEVMLVGSIASLKEALTVEAARTLTAPPVGVVALTVGATGGFWPPLEELPQAASERSMNAAPTLDRFDIDFTFAPWHGLRAIPKGAAR